MSGPVSAAVGAECIVVLAIFMAAAAYVNFGAIIEAISQW